MVRKLREMESHDMVRVTDMNVSRSTQPCFCETIDLIIWFKCMRSETELTCKQCGPQQNEQECCS